MNFLLFVEFMEGGKKMHIFSNSYIRTICLQCKKSEIHRDEEGKDLLGKRTMDFKVSYLDAGLATSYFEGDAPSPSSGTSHK